MAARGRSQSPPHAFFIDEEIHHDHALVEPDRSPAHCCRLRTRRTRLHAAARCERCKERGGDRAATQIGALANLVIEDAEEAKVLIPERALVSPL